MTIADTARLLNSPYLGEGCEIEDFVIIGKHNSGVLQPTVIGRNATIRSHTVIYGGNKIGNSFATGHGALIRELNSIGDNVSIGSHSIVEHHVVIENGVRVHSGAFIPEYTLLEENVWIGPRVAITNTVHPKCPNMPNCIEGVIVKSGAKIGANATILPGVVIGENVLVGAGSVVTKNVEPGTVVVGNPAKAIGKVTDLVCPWDMLTKPY